MLKEERIGLTNRHVMIIKRTLITSFRKGATYGYHNGVDIRLLRNHQVPLINDDTEIGRSIGATVDVTRDDGAVEFGTRDKIFQAWKHNRY